MDAFRERGTARATIEDDLDGARRTLASLPKAGIDLDAVTDKLVEDGVQLFADAFDKLLEAVERKRIKFLGAKSATHAASLPGDLGKAVDAELETWRAGGKIRRLWARDASLWSGADEAKWLGWLDIVPRLGTTLPALDRLADAAARYRHVLLLGMGGSSLGPEVLARIFGRQAGHPLLHVLDSTDPAQIKDFEQRIELESTLFIVSSKSGGTLETSLLKQYFFERASAVLGPAEAAKRFVAVTDPGSSLHQSAEREGFGHVFVGDPEIGGRYSVLSAFGLVPAAAIGLDIGHFLAVTETMIRSCGPDVPPAANPGVALGLILGVAGRHGRDKVTIVAGPGLDDFGTWAEQLIAESTGKNGKALIPVAAETLAAPGAYGQDRIFVHLEFSSRPDPQAGQLAALAAEGHPVVRLALAGPEQLGQEFFRWEIATSVAGAVLGIDPFDQPDVEASKVAARALTDAYEKSGSLPAEAPFFDGDGIKLFADAGNEAALAGRGSLDAVIAAHLGRIGAGDYVAILAYLCQDQPTTAALQAVRHLIRDRRRVATCLGFGPRFLHSTGQAYKGGPNTGVFLQITGDDAADLAVPQRRYSFGTVKAAQARGDFAVLAERGRRALRIHLGADRQKGLERLLAAVTRALG